MARYNYGDVGPDSFQWDIEDLQRNLSDYGIPTEVNGVFGPGTSASVARFQLEQSLPVTGKADSTTVDKLVGIMADKARVSSLAKQQPSQKIDMDPLYITGQVPNKIPWWLVVGGVLVAWKVLTK